MFGSIEKNHVISEQCFKGTFLQRNDREMIIICKIPLLKHLGAMCSMTVLYPNLCYNEVCYKETVGLQIRMCTKKLFFLFLNQVVGTQKNRLDETVLLSTQNIS